MIKKKKPFTLLETLIAVAIISVLLTMVFGFFREISHMSLITDELQQQSFRMRYAEMRLAYLFERLVNENEVTKRAFFFFSDKPDKGVLEGTPSLVFTFDNEARANPSFAGDQLARLYVDPENRLCLAIWPVSSEQPHSEMHKEILLENVTELAFEFYMPPLRAEKKQEDDPKKEPEGDRWHSEWLSSFEQMPGIVKVKVKIAKDPKNRKETAKSHEYAFVLPSSKNYIYYPSDT